MYIVYIILYTCIRWCWGAVQCACKYATGPILWAVCVNTWLGADCYCRITHALYILYIMCIYDESMHHDSRVDKAAAAAAMMCEPKKKTRHVHLQRARRTVIVEESKKKHHRWNARRRGEQTRITSAASARAP